MKRINSIEEMPQELLDHFEFVQEDLDALTWEEIEDEIISMFSDFVSYRDKDPKKKDDYYLYHYDLKIGENIYTAMTHRFIKEIDVICYPEPHGLFVKQWYDKII